MDIDELKKIDFFRAWNDSLLLELAPFCKKITLSDGDYLVHENDYSRDLHVILKGQLILEKVGQTGKNRINFGQLEAGQIVGEIAFLDAQLRSCDVLAKGEATLLQVSEKVIQNQNLFDQLARQIQKTLFERLRNTNASLVDTLQKEIELLAEKLRLSRLFVSSIFTLVIVILVNRILVFDMKIVPLGSGFAWLYLFALAVPIFANFFLSRAPLSAFGISFENLPKQIANSFLLSIPCILAIYAASILKNDLNWWDIVGASDPKRIAIAPFVGYTMISFAQQLLRCGFQVSLKELFNKRKNLYAILMSSLLFGIMHIHLGMLAVGVTFCAGVLFGYLFLLQRNIFSITLFHTLLGYAAFTFSLLPS